MTRKEKIVSAGCLVFFLGGWAFALGGQQRIQKELLHLEKEVLSEKETLETYQKEAALCEDHEKRVENWRRRGVFTPEKKKELPQQVISLLEKHHLTLVSFSSEGKYQLKFSGVLDLDFFHFLAELKNSAPGLIQEKFLMIERCDERDNEPKIQGELHFDLVTFSLPS